jgi:hypothetical protein
MRAFDPRAVGRRECGAWVAYYRRQWARFLVDAVGMIRAGFAMSWPRTLYGAWLVLRANQLWAPAEGNDPDGARRSMRRFYQLVISAHTEPPRPPASRWNGGASTGNPSGTCRTAPIPS